MLKDPKVSYEIKYPNGSTETKRGDVTGWIKNRQQLVKLLQHASHTANVTISKLVQVGDDEKPLAAQPPELAESNPASPVLEIESSKPESAIIQ